MQAIELGLRICGWIGVALIVLQGYRGLFFVVGFFKRKTFSITENKHAYGICVAARNEGAVIENFLDSVAGQDYPLDRLTVFIVAHNCTDETAKIARAYKKNGLNVVVYEHNAPDERTKGYALKALFEKIEKEYGTQAFDGYFIFDADNVIAPNYVTKMNEAFDEGNKIVTSFRNSKNLSQNWISYGYAMHWMRTCLTENRGKAVLKQSCRVQGTGFLFANELVKEGWKYTSLTEDRSFCTDAVLQNYRVSYCDEAIFYDEQPCRLKVALRQRLRWAKGHLQSTVENCPKLLKKIFRFNASFSVAYDCFWLNFPHSIESGIRRSLKLTLQLLTAILIGGIWGWWIGVLVGYLEGKIGSWLTDFLFQAAVFFRYKKRLDLPKSFFRLGFYMLTFPLFNIIGKWCSYVALFKKVDWKPIPHGWVMNVNNLKKD